MTMDIKVYVWPRYLMLNASTDNVCLKVSLTVSEGINVEFGLTPENGCLKRGGV